MILAVGFWADLGLTAVLPALAVVLLGLALGFVLSPAGRPAPPQRRTGGFSRAIADRTDGEGGAA